MGKVAVITGASSGIGKSLAIQLAIKYNKLFICGRNRQALDELKSTIVEKGSNAIVIELDLSDSVSVKQAAKSIQSQTDQIELLVNNAGISQRSTVFDTPEELEAQLFQINYFGPVLLTKLLLPELRKSKKAKILLTSSIVGKFGFPLRSTYSAAKHALHGYFESLRLEEEGNGITVHIMVVGRAKTNISMNALTEDGDKHGKLDKGQAGGISSEKCAQKMIRAMNKSKKETLIGGKEILMVYFKKYIPFLFYKLAKKEVNHV